MMATDLCRESFAARQTTATERAKGSYVCR